MTDGFVEFRRRGGGGARSQYTVQVRASSIEVVDAYGSRAVLRLASGVTIEVEHPVEDVLEKLRVFEEEER